MSDAAGWSPPDDASVPPSEPHPVWASSTNRPTVYTRILDRTGCSFPSGGGVAAVDGERDSDHEAGAWAAEPHGGRGDLVGGPEASDRLVAERLGHVQFAARNHGFDHRCVDRAGADPVDADAAGCVLECGALGES